MNKSIENILNILNDDMVLTNEIKELESTANENSRDVIDAASIKDHELVSETDPKDLIFHKEEYSKQLRSKLYPVNQRLDLATMSDEDRQEQNKNLITHLKEKLKNVIQIIDQQD